MNYFMSLDPLALFRSMPGAFAQGMVWGLMALGVYITYRLLDFADLTVDGSLATGGAVAVMLIRGGMSPWAALIFDGSPHPHNIPVLLQTTSHPPSFKHMNNCLYVYNMLCHTLCQVSFLQLLEKFK